MRTGLPCPAHTVESHIITSPDGCTPSRAALDRCRLVFLGREGASLWKAARGDDFVGAQKALQRGANPALVPREGLSDAMVAYLRTAEKIRALRVDLQEAVAGSEPSPLDQALWEFDRHGALQQFESSRNGRRDEAIWADAVRARDTPTLRAFIALVSDERIHELAAVGLAPSRDHRVQYRQSLLHQGMGHPSYGVALWDYLRSLFHYSDRLGPLRSYNLVSDSAGIACRHLAQKWIDHRVQGGHDLDYSHVASPEAMQRSFDLADLNARYHQLIATARESYLVGHAEFGSFLADLWAEMQEGQVRRMLVGSGNHAMALELRKMPPEGKGFQPLCEVQFYDPGVSSGHREALTGDPRVIARWNLAAMLPNASADRAYYPGTDKVSMVHMVPEGPPDDSDSDAAPERRTLRGAYVPTLLTPKAIWLLVTNGFDGTLSELAPHLQWLPLEERFAALTASTRSSIPLFDGVPAFHYACADGPRTMVSAFMRMVFQSGLSENEQLTALGGIRPADGKTALDVLFDGDDPGKLALYVDEVLRSDLSDHGKVQCLRGQGGGPSLYRAAGAGKAEAVGAFVERVANSDLPLPCKMELLNARGSDRCTALYTACRADEHEVVRAFVEPVLASDLPQEAKLELMNGPVSHTGTGAFLIGAKNRSHRAVRAFGERILNSGLPPMRQLQLFLAPRRDSACAVHVALINHDTQMLDTLQRLLTDARLPPEAVGMAIAEALTANGPDQRPVLHTLVEGGPGTRTLDLLSNFLTSFRLTPELRDLIDMALGRRGL